MDEELLLSNEFERIASIMPDSRFGRSYRNGIEERSDYPSGGEILGEMTQILQDIITGRPDLATDGMLKLQREVEALVETHLEISAALKALIPALRELNRDEMASQVAGLLLLHQIAYGS